MGVLEAVKAEWPGKTPDELQRIAQDAADRLLKGEQISKRELRLLQAEPEEYRLFRKELRAVRRYRARKGYPRV